MKKMLLLAAFMFALPLHAQAMAAWSGQVIMNGNTKDCIYQYNGQNYSLTVPSTENCPMQAKVPVSGTTAMAFYTGYRIENAVKVCEYSYAGKKYELVVQSYVVCEMNIQVSP